MKNLSKGLWKNNSQLKMSHVLSFYSVNKNPGKKLDQQESELKAFNPMEKSNHSL